MRQILEGKISEHDLDDQCKTSMAVVKMNPGALDKINAAEEAWRW